MRGTISKRKLVNTLFVLGFPMYGIGLYRAFKGNLSEGLVFAIVPFLLIIVIHAIDLLYAGRFRIMVGRVYWLGLFYLMTLAGSMWHAFAEGFPGFNAINTTAQTLLFLVPFHAAVIMQVRNRDHDGFDMSRLVLIALILLMAVNMIGYAMGMRNLVHGFEGRMNLPFLKGVYDAAHILSIINLMLLFYLKDPVRYPFRFAALAAIYVANLAVMININSRLSFMVFLVFTLLFLFRVMKGLRVLFTVSLFTMPLLVSFAHLVYKILSLPVFATIIERVDKEDVTTFNSRTYIWEEAWNWLVDDRRGLLLGNGFNGQYGLGMMDQIAVMWETDQPFDIHMHSTFLQVLIGQGVLGYVLMCLCMWHAYSRFRAHYLAGTNAAPLYAAVVYMLFIWQIDIFMYGMEIGNALFFCVLAYFALDDRYVTRQQRLLGNQAMA